MHASPLPSDARIDHRADRRARLSLVIAFRPRHSAITAIRTQRRTWPSRRPTADGQIVRSSTAGRRISWRHVRGDPGRHRRVPVGNGHLVDVYVTHEQSHVPFGGLADYQDSSVYRARLDRERAGRRAGRGPAARRLHSVLLCLYGWAGRGLLDHTLFVNEESNDNIDVPAGAPYGADPALAPYREAGYVVALDTATARIADAAAWGATTTRTRSSSRAGGRDRDPFRRRHVQRTVLPDLPAHGERSDEALGTKASCGPSR